MAKTAAIDSKAKNGTSCVVKTDADAGKFVTKTNKSEDRAAKRKALTIKAFNAAYESHTKKG